MKRVILRVPAGLRFADLPEEQQAAIQTVFAQFVLPVPGTIEADGYELVDGLTGDNFDPEVMPGLGMDWPVLGLWQWDGAGDLVALQSLADELFLRHLPPENLLSEDEVIETQPPTLHEPHRWAGWPLLL